MDLAVFQMLRQDFFIKNPIYAWFKLICSVCLYLCAKLISTYLEYVIPKGMPTTKVNHTVAVELSGIVKDLVSVTEQVL